MSAISIPARSVVSTTSRAAGPDAGWVPAAFSPSARSGMVGCPSTISATAPSVSGTAVIGLGGEVFVRERGWAAAASAASWAAAGCAAIAATDARVGIATGPPTVASGAVVTAGRLLVVGRSEAGGRSPRKTSL